LGAFAVRVETFVSVFVNLTALSLLAAVAIFAVKLFFP